MWPGIPLCQQYVKIRTIGVLTKWWNAVMEYNMKTTQCKATVNIVSTSH